MPDYARHSTLLKLKPFRGTAAAILRELAEPAVLEGDFLLDPAGFLAQRLRGGAAARVPRRRLDAANRFLFSILSNERFAAWLRDYQEQALREIAEDPHPVIDKDRIRLDLARAMLEFGDAEIVSAALPGRFRPDFQDPDTVFDVIGNISGLPVNAIQTFAQEVSVAQVVAGRGHEVADVAVEIEILIYAVAAAAVFVVAVAAAVIGAAERFDQRFATRDLFVDTGDMVRIADALARMGSELRAQGRL